MRGGLTLTLVVTIFSLILPLRGLAQSPAQMERLTWKAGDHWTYEWKSTRAGKPGGNGRFVLTVLRTGDYEGTQAYFVQNDGQWTDAAGKPGKSLRTVIRDMDLTLLGRLDEHGKPVLRQKYGWLKWPLVDGAQWNVDGEYEFLDRSNWVKRHGTGVSFGKGVDEVTTAAGTFHGFHVQSIWRWASDSGAALGHSQEDYWFAADARTWVKWVAQDGDYQEEGGLVEYHLAH